MSKRYSGYNTPYFKHFAAKITHKNGEIDSTKILKQKIYLLMKKLNLDIVERLAHQFDPQGLTLLYVLSSSHLAVHTWPENNFLHIDLVLCKQGVEKSHFDNTVQDVFSGYHIETEELRY